MGVSPWTSRFELWGAKTDLLPKSEPNSFQVAAMRRGHDLEPEARELAETQFQMRFPPVVGQHEEHVFLRASFDGFNAETGTILEIKCPSKADHAKALKGVVPDKYYPQLQFQMLVAGADRAIYFSYNGKKGEKGSTAHVYVQANPEYQKLLLQECIGFWHLVTTKTPPRVAPEDLCRVVDELSKATKKLLQLEEGLKVLCAAFVTNTFEVGGTK